MKKILLIGILVISGLSFARDYEYREKLELQPVEYTSYGDQTMISRERIITESNIENYKEFHEELSNMDRGSEKN